MARLNEPPVAPDSLEALKRKVLRQNRDFARTHTIQCIRIRALETEVSRLLTENIELREENMQLRLSMEEVHSAGQGFNGLKQQLEGKLQEIGSLIADLEGIRKPMIGLRTRRATTRPQRFEGDTIGGADEGRLPALMEDKPWSTLEQSNGFVDGFGRSSNSPADSFELEPAPVAQFHDEDIPHQVDQLQQVESEDSTLTNVPSVNLESRRRRRESVQAKRVMAFDESPPEKVIAPAVQPPVTVSSIRAGAKRKLNLRDEDSSAGLSLRETASSSETEVNMREETSRSRPKVKEPVKNVDAKQTTTQRSVTTAGKLDRRALGEKPINTDPVVSPRKLKRSADEKLAKPTVLSIAPAHEAALLRIKERKAAREEKERKESKIEQALNIPESLVMDTIEQDLPPTTPATLDFFSPLGSRPSTERQISRDTPPPMLSTGSGMEPAGRVSRRARAVVSYAEPNLISKMRRPTKQLVDAVGKDGRPLVGAMVIREEKGRLRESFTSQDQSEWRPDSNMTSDDLIVKEAPPSPLGSKTLEVVKSLDLEPRLSQSTLGAKIETRKRSNSVMNGTTSAQFQEKDGGKQWPQDLSIFDFQSSSPEKKIEPKSAVGSRRRSTMSKSGDEEDGRVARQTSRRRSMMV